MAVFFKIKKGKAANLPSTRVEGTVYITTDENKMYIDLSNDSGGRVCLNARQADILSCGDVGATNKPVYFVGGEPAACTTYAGGSRVKLNGTTKGGSTVDVWTPTAAGTAGQILVSTGAAPAWSSTTYAQTKQSTGRTTAGTITSFGIYGQTYGNDATYLAKSGVLSYGDPGPQINFSASTTGTQKGAIIFTDHDTIGTGASFNFVSTETNTWLIAPTIKALTKFIGTLQGNAATASTLETKRKISLSGDASGSVNFDGSADVTLSVTVADDSHNHIISNVDGLQDTLNNKMSVNPTSIEINSSGGLKSYGGFIDFHFHNSEGKPTNAAGTVVTTTPDYTSRIIESTAGTLSINGATFKGGVMTGSLNGNAKTATALETAVNINGTSFNGTASITTAKWGTSRKISISSAAGTTGTSVDGSADITLKIPSTMTGFSSITSSVFRGIVRRTFDRDTSNAIQGITWYDSNDTTLHQYIMGHNTSNAIIINPKYDSAKDPWNSTDGLYITDSQIKFNNSQLLTASNYTDYTVKKDGTGASGTWGISISGNAATATTATTANKVANALSINGKTYNGSAAINAGTIGIGYGGTGATTAPNARVNLLSIGNNPITKPADDTVVKWGAYGPGATAFYSVTGQLTDQPSQWGFVHNIMTTTGSEIHQLWATQSSGDMYHRGGNSSGWSGTWRRFLDSVNYSTYVLPLSGGTVTGTLILSKTTDAATTTDNGPALIVGGTRTTAHIEIDNNEILAKSNGTTETDLYLGTTSSKVHIGQSNVGSSTGPIYLAGGVPTACSGRTVPGIKSASAVGTLGWGTNNTYVADISLLAYWNGAYSNTNSNLQYCDRGRFGTMATKDASNYYTATECNTNYVNVTGDTMTGNLLMKGTNPYIGFQDSSGATKGYVQYIQSDDTYAIGAGVAKSLVVTNSGSISIPASQTFTPKTNATGGIGTSALNWNEVHTKTIKSSTTIYITPSSTMYVDSGSGSSIIFRPQGTEQARFNTSGQLLIKATGAASATVIGPGTAGTFYFPNTGGTFVTHATRGTAVGSATLPVYIASTGRATACTASSLFSAMTWSAGTSAGPILNVTVAGQKRTATIPTATASASGIVTTGAQTFAGAKTFNSNINTGSYVNSTAVRGGMWISGTHDASFVVSAATTAAAGQFYQGWFAGKTQSGAWSLGALSGSEDLYFVYGTDANYNAGTNTTVQATKIQASTGRLFGAAWNDYAEFRICNEQFEPGQVVFENGDDTVSVSTKRLQRGCSITSDTFGFAIGETDEAKCPIAVSGRVLAYPYESLEEFAKHIGYPVCSGPNGTVSIMTDEEEEKYPSRIIGTISAIPSYETWGQSNVLVNGRVWIKIK